MKVGYQVPLVLLDPGPPLHLWSYITIGSFSNADSNSKENVKKAIGLISKTITTMHVKHTFLYVSLPSLHDYDMKFPHGSFYGECKHKTTNFFFSL